MCLPLKPYKVELEWKAFGLSCAVVLAREAGHRCGYVRVPPTHPVHGKKYDAVDVDVHGGLTFAEIEPCKEHEDGQGWWLGFDCAHSGDAYCDPDVGIDELHTEEAKISLAVHRSISHGHPMPYEEHYWTEAEVVVETERLAAQLAALR